MSIDFSLTPLSGTLLLLVMVFAGRAFRINWKAQKDGWVRRAWLYGVLVTIAFFFLALVPLQSGQVPG
ncbi:MAG: hypothetical protein AAGG56_02675 [Pseudomonadota bacterium]